MPRFYISGSDMRTIRILQALCAASLVGIILIPAIQLIAPFVDEKPLTGWVPHGEPQPELSIKSIIDGKFQRWASTYLADHAGFRPTMVRTYNEAIYQLTEEAPNIGVFKSNGRLFTSEQILNVSKVYRDEGNYRRASRDDAAGLRAIQDDLASKGKYFVVLLAASKPSIYIDSVPRRFLPDGLPDDFSVNGSMADELRKAGVNVIDSTVMMRQLRSEGIPTHSDSGVHWNYFSGCVIASEIMRQAQKHVRGGVNQIGCGTPTFSKPEGADDDALLLMNIWSDGGVKTTTPKPKLSLYGDTKRLPKIVLVGDSFSWQIVAAMSYSSAYSELVYSGYLRSRYAIKPGTGEHLSAEGEDVPQTKIIREVARDIDQSDIIVLEQVDYVRTPPERPREHDWFGFMHYMTPLFLTTGAAQSTVAN
jgi:hypothetical protein